MHVTMNDGTVSARKAGWLVAALVLWEVGSAGCGGATANRPPPVSTAQAADVDEETVGLMEQHRYHHHGGVTLLIALSLDTLGVSSDHRDPVNRIRGELHAGMEPARAAEQHLVTVLADGLASATLDAVSIDTAVAQVADAAAKVHDACIEPLNELHAVLTPVERASLVDKVEAHWAIWRKSNGEEGDTSNPEPARLEALTTHLGLAKEQVDKIRARLGEAHTLPFDAQDITAHLRAFGDAFRSEKFDAKTLTTAGVANSQLAGWGAARMARFVKAASPVLTADQRSHFAISLRAHADHDNGGKP
jgi:hypothetical protein